MRKGFLKKILCVGIAAAAAAAFSGCAKQETVSTISVITKTQNLEFWDVVNNGAAAAGEELGYNIVCDAPESEVQIGVQIDLIDKAVKNGSKAIIIAPINGVDLNEALKSAESKGVKIVTIDTKTANDTFSYVGSDNYSAGAIAGREAKKLIDASGKIGVIALSEGSPSSSSRVEGFKSELGLDSDSGDVKASVVDVKYCDSDKATAKQQALELISDHPDIEMIFGVNQNSTIGICEAVAEKGLSGSIDVVGFNASEEEIDYIKSGVLKGTIVQNPFNMGYLGVRNAVKLIDGESVPLVTDTGVTYISMDNLDDESVQQLLYPLAE